MSELIKQFFSDASVLLQKHKDSLRRWGASLGVSLVLGVLGINVYGASSQANEHTQLWELVIASRLFLFRLVAAIGTVLVGFALVMLLINWLDNTKLGERIFHKTDGSDPVANLRNIATVFLGICVLVGLIFSGVPR